MSSPTFLACCISRKEPKETGDIEMSKEIMDQKVNRSSTNVLVMNSPDISPVKAAKYGRYSASKYSSATKTSSLSASRGASTDDSFYVEKSENIKPYTNRQWFRVIWNNDLDNTPANELSHSLRHGISDEMRPMIWEFLVQMEKMKKEHPKDYYKTLKSSPSAMDDQIKKDLGRTFPNHPLFKSENSRGQKAMFNILRAYANHDKEIGYTQGMNFVVGKLLMIMDPEEYCASELDYYDNYEKEYEEKTFWVYYHLLQVKNCRLIYKDQFAKIHEMTRVLDEKIKDNIPEVHDLIHNSEVDVSNCFYSMFICLLLDSAPLPLAKRIVDLFLIEGETVLFKVIVRALLICKNYIVDAGEKGVTYLHQLLKHDLLSTVFKQHKNQLYVLFPGYDSFQ